MEVCVITTTTWSIEVLRIVVKTVAISFKTLSSFDLTHRGSWEYPTIKTVRTILPPVSSKMLVPHKMEA